MTGAVSLMGTVGWGSGMNYPKLTNYFSCILSYTNISEFIATTQSLLILFGLFYSILASPIILFRARMI